MKKRTKLPQGPGQKVAYEVGDSIAHDEMLEKLDKQIEHRFDKDNPGMGAFRVLYARSLSNFDYLKEDGASQGVVGRKRLLLGSPFEELEAKTQLDHGCYMALKEFIHMPRDEFFRFPRADMIHMLAEKEASLGQRVKLGKKLGRNEYDYLLGDPLERLQAKHELLGYDLRDHKESFQVQIIVPAQELIFGLLPREGGR